MLAEDDRHDAIVERMPQLQAFECRALDARQFPRARDARALQHRIGQVACEHQQLGSVDEFSHRFARDTDLVEPGIGAATSNSE